MKGSIIALVSLSAAVAFAQPHKPHQQQHQHQKHHEKRAIVWTTEWEVVTETLDITTTIWVDGKSTAAPETQTSSLVTTTSSSSVSTKAPADFHESTASSASPTSDSVAPSEAPVSVSSSSAVDVPPPSPPSPGPTSVGPVEQPLTTASSTPVEMPVSPPSPTSIVQPANNPPSVEQPATTSSTSPVEQQPSTPADVPPPVTQTPAVQAAPTTQAALAAPTSTPAPVGGQFASPATGPCTPSTPCSGDMTYYEAGLGACGITNDGDNEMVIALPVGLMGSQSNGNPFCGKTVKIKNGETEITATVVDKCMGCKDYAIDLSNKAFLGLGEQLSVGRKVISWYFTD